MSNVAILCDGYWQGGHDHILKNRGHKLSFGTTHPDTEVAIVGTQEIDFEEYQYLAGLVRLGVGYDNVPCQRFRDNGTIIAYTPNAPSQAVAEHAFGLMLRGIRSRNRSKPGMSLSEISVAIIGRGRIGKRFAAMLSPFDVHMLAVDPVHDTTFDEIHDVCILDSLHEALTADVVSMHVPLEDATRDMVDAEFLLSMNEDAVLINTARGGILNEEDLYLHLKDKPNFTAALDVTKEEPYTGPLRDLPNCIMTPHVASMTIKARENMERDALKAALAILNADEPRWVIPVREPWHK